MAFFSNLELNRNTYRKQLLGDILFWDLRK